MRIIQDLKIAKMLPIRSGVQFVNPDSNRLTDDALNLALRRDITLVKKIIKTLAFNVITLVKHVMVLTITSAQNVTAMPISMKNLLLTNIATTNP